MQSTSELPQLELIPYRTKEQEISGRSTQGIPCLVYGDIKNAPNGMIVYLHGGPSVQLTKINERNPNNPNPENFFQNLVAAGFVVIVPDIRGSAIDDNYHLAASEFDGRLYTKDISDVVHHYQEQSNLPADKIYGVFHSLGVHQGLHAILKDQSLFAKVILLGGTLYFGARTFHEYAKELFQERLTSTSSVEDLKSFMQRLKGSVDLIQHLDLRQGKNSAHINSIIYSAMANPQLNEDISIGLNTSRLPTIPFLIAHARPDKQVPAEFTLEFWKSLSHQQGKNIEAHLYSGGDHYFFYSATDNPFFQTMLSFLKRGKDAESKIYLDSQESTYEALAKHFPENSVLAHQQFLASKSLMFNNKSLLGLEDWLILYLENINVLESRLGEIEKSITGRWTRFFKEFNDNHIIPIIREQAKELLELIRSTKLEKKL